MTAESRPGIVTTLFNEAKYAWQYLKRGYSDHQVVQWREIREGIITKVQINSFRQEVFASCFTNRPKGLGRHFPSPEFSPSAIADWAMNVFGTTDELIRDELMNDACEKLARFGLLSRAKFDITAGTKS